MTCFLGLNRTHFFLRVFDEAPAPPGFGWMSTTHNFLGCRVKCVLDFTPWFLVIRMCRSPAGIRSVIYHTVHFLGSWRRVLGAACATASDTNRIGAGFSTAPWRSMFVHLIMYACKSFKLTLSWDLDGVQGPCFDAFVGIMGCGILGGVFSFPSCFSWDWKLLRGAHHSVLMIERDSAHEHLACPLAAKSPRRSLFL